MQSITKTVRVYISSTYSDMHAERRVLHDIVFPELRRRLAPHGVELLAVDPCLGATTHTAEGDDAPGSRLLLIDACRPYFIGILGERYGKILAPASLELLWTFPRLEGGAGASLLEWEIRLASDGLEPAAQRTFYYFRDPRFLRDIPPARRGDFWPENEEAAARLGVLKFRLRTSGGPVMDGYECRWNARKDEADGLDDFARQVTSDLWDAIAADYAVGEPTPSDDNVQFTVYRPKVVAPAKWYPMLAFAHLEELPGDADPDEPDPVAEVKRQARALLGEQAANFKDSTQDALVAVPRKGEISFVPRCEGITFSPTRRFFRWTERVHREEFRLMAGAELDGRTAKGSVSVFFGSILIAEITLSIQVRSGAPKESTPAPNQKTSARPYRKIFASYSHKDLHVVQEFEHYARTMGDAYIRDWVNLRSGEDWNERLRGMIEEADVFQLFWSTHALGSRYVEQEWRHALALGRPNFVRPVYWEDPLPAAPERNLPPDELSRLHFHRLTLHGLAPAVPPTHGKGVPVEDIEFELSVDDSDEAGSSEFELSLDASDESSALVIADENSDSEFELTLDDDGGLAAGDEDGKDIFEDTSFDVPALDDDSGSEAVAIDDADTDLEGSDFEISLDEDSSTDDSAGSEVVNLDEDEEADEGAATVARAKKPAKKGKIGAAVVPDESQVDLDIEDSAPAAKKGKKADDDDDEDDCEYAPSARRSRSAPRARSEVKEWLIAALVSLLVVLGFFATLWFLRR